MKNFWLFLVIIFTIILFGGYLISIVNYEKQKTQLAVVPPVTFEYFYTQECPHCIKVSEFLENWEGKVEIEKVEVDASQENAIKYYQRGAFCKISERNLGIPLFVNPTGECILGDEAIIEYLNNSEI